MENTEPLSDREEIVGRWALRPPQCQGTITYFVWLLKDATALWSDTYNAYEGGFLDQVTTERLFREDRLWREVEVSLVLRQFSIPIQLSVKVHALISLLNGFGIFGREDAGNATDADIAADTLAMDRLLDAEIKPQIDRKIREFEPSPVESLPVVASAPAMCPNPSDFVMTSASRVVGRWILFLWWAACPAHYGIFVRSNGIVELYDLFTHALTVEATPAAWFDRIHRRDFFEGLRGEEAEEICKYTRRIRIDRSLLKLILRANRRDVVWIKQPDPLAEKINARLEDVFWRTVAKFLPYQPRKRKTLLEPMKIPPGDGLIIRNDPWLP